MLSKAYSVSDGRQSEKVVYNSGRHPKMDNVAADWLMTTSRFIITLRLVAARRSLPEKGIYTRMVYRLVVGLR